MKLAIFDIDGTLTLSNEADEFCFLKTAQALIDPKINELVPEAFTHYTDQNIVRELYLWHKGYEPTEKEYLDFKQMLRANLIQLGSEKPEMFNAIAGVNEMMQNLHSDWKIGLATGCWSFSAEIKLNQSAINIPDSATISNSDRALSRLEILENAILTAKNNFKTYTFEKIVYIGDGIWDLKTCRTAGIPFVGIEAEGRLNKRTALGSFWKLENYLNIGYFRSCLENALVPH